jgi:hypothetical protein
VADSDHSATVYQLILFSSSDGQYYPYALGDVARTLNTRTYQPGYAIKVGEIKDSASNADGEVEITLPSNTPVAEAFQGGVPDAEWTVQIYMGHDGDAGVIELWKGLIITASFEDLSGTNASHTKLTCKSRLGALYQSALPYRFGSSCQHSVYRGGCNLNQTANSFEYPLIAVDGLQLQATGFASHPDGEFANGFIRLGSAYRAVSAHVGNTVTLSRPLPLAGVGSLVTIFRGCDRSKARCIYLGNFSNIFRFDIPTRNIFKEGVK